MWRFFLEKWVALPSKAAIRKSVSQALQIGKGRALLASMDGQTNIWYSTSRVDSLSGESYPELEPSLLSWNSSRGWCTFCRGYGRIYEWMKDDLPASGKWWNMSDGQICPECKGDRLNPISRNIVLVGKRNNLMSLPQLLRNTPVQIITFLTSCNTRNASNQLHPL